MKTHPVIYRAFIDSGEVIALFPDTPATLNPSDCMSYMHIGQHGAACVGLTGDGSTRPATVAEAAPLAHELACIGYRLRPVARRTRGHDVARVRELVAMRTACAG